MFDRGFLSADLLCALTAGGTERHFLIPAKSNIYWEVIEGDEAGGDFTVRMRMRVQSVLSYQSIGRRGPLPSSMTRGASVFCSLRDRRRYQPADIANCYRRRWGIETSYRELKQIMLGATLTLRSKTVDGVYQEIWGR